MTSQSVPESDWKAFRQLQEAAERFCERVLEEIESLRSKSSRSHHERYFDIFQLLQQRNEELAHAFNDPRRSTMLLQLAAMRAHGLVEPEELARFTPETRDTTKSMAEQYSG